MNEDSDATSIKLDPTTADLLTRLAKAWGTTIQGAIRRVVEEANSANGSASNEERLAAFEELQRSINLTSTKAIEWQQRVLDSRR